MNILILPGDGIGPEIVAVAERALVALNDRFSLGLVFERAEIGLASLEKSGSTLPDGVAAKARAADGVVLGPVSTHIYPSATEGGINVSAWCRTQLDLYANIRPSAVRAGVPSHVPAMDLIIVRENTEGFYADRNMAWGSGEFMPTEDVALAVGKATRAGCHRIAVAACELAMRRNRHLTVVHKANVLKKYSGLFLDTACEVAAGYPDLVVDDFIVDAMAALLVREPQNFDVIVTTNMFGDILSDEAAELAGGLGLASSLNAGDVHAVAQAAHGSAPDIAGQDIANPAAILHSTAMLLEHLGAKTSDNGLAVAAQCLVSGTDAVLADDSTRTRDLGGTGGTKAFGDALIERIRKAQ
jgi:isocitrate/isopropylmalate dehydrogenase